MHRQARQLQVGAHRRGITLRVLRQFQLGQHAVAAVLELALQRFPLHLHVARSARQVDRDRRGRCRGTRRRIRRSGIEHALDGVGDVVGALPVQAGPVRIEQDVAIDAVVVLVVQIEAHSLVDFGNQFGDVDETAQVGAVDRTAVDLHDAAEMVDIQVAPGDMALPEGLEFLPAVRRRQVVLGQYGHENRGPVELLLDLRVEELIARKPAFVAPQFDSAGPDALTDRFAKRILEHFDPTSILRPVRLIVAMTIAEKDLLGNHRSSLSCAIAGVNTEPQERIILPRV